jgi:hypothetical protein
LREDSGVSDSSPPAGEPPEHPGPARALGVLALMLALAAGGWFLVEKLGADSSVQDCVMAGRSNCAPLDPTPSLPSSSSPR